MSINEHKSLEEDFKKKKKRVDEGFGFNATSEQILWATKVQCSYTSYLVVSKITVLICKHTKQAFSLNKVIFLAFDNISDS